MKKHSRLRSVLAMFLAFSMFFQQTSIISWASDENAGVEATVTPTSIPTAAPDESPEVPEPTEIPVEPTAEPEPTEAPLEPTEVPAEPTTAPTAVPTEEPAQPTEVPAQPTVEPEPTGEPTVVPTEVPAEPTEVPTETPQPTETPTPTPAFKSEFSFSGNWGNAKVSLTDPEAMSDQAEFFVSEKTSDTDFFANAYGLVEQYAAQNGLVVLDGSVYDMGFRIDGQEVEPERGSANVNMTFVNPLNFDIQDIEGAKVLAFHIENGTAINVSTKIDLTDDKRVSSIGMQLNSFSPIVIAALADESLFSDDGIANLEYYGDLVFRFASLTAPGGYIISDNVFKVDLYDENDNYLQSQYATGSELTSGRAYVRFNVPLEEGKNNIFTAKVDTSYSG